MAKIPKKTGTNWGLIATIIGGVVFLSVSFAMIFGPAMGGHHLGNFAFGCIMSAIGFAITKNLVVKKARAKVKYEKNDADVFTNGWSDLLCIIIMGIIICIINGMTTMSIKYLIMAVLFVPFYYIYKSIFEKAELEFYAKYNTAKGIKDKNLTNTTKSIKLPEKEQTYYNDQGYDDESF